MKPEINRVEYLLNKNIPILIYNGQMDLIVSTPGPCVGLIEFSSPRLNFSERIVFWLEG